MCMISKTKRYCYEQFFGNVISFSVFVMLYSQKKTTLNYVEFKDPTSAYGIQNGCMVWWNDSWCQTIGGNSNPPKK